MSTSTILPKVENQWWIFSPAVKKENCEIDNTLLKDRALKIFCVAIAGFVAAFCFPPAAIYLAFFSLSIIVIPYIDSVMAGKAADRKAVQEYLQKETPSASARKRICDNIRLAQELVNKDNINKRDAEGQYLLSPYKYKNPEGLFQAVARNGFNFANPLPGHLDNPSSFFSELVENNHVEYLEFLLKNKFVTPDQFSPTQQFVLWKDITTAKPAQLLREYGFDINIRAQVEGHGHHFLTTPLLYAVHPVNYIPAANKIGRAAYVRILLECGADPTMTREIERMEQQRGGNSVRVIRRLNAFEMHTTPQVAAVLEEFRPKK